MSGYPRKEIQHNFSLDSALFGNPAIIAFYKSVRPVALRPNLSISLLVSKAIFYKRSTFSIIPSEKGNFKMR